MPTLNIEGKKVRVDDSFLQLSPEEQSRTVDEIAGQLGVVPQNRNAAPMLSAQPNAKGLLAPGNIDLAKRPVVKNPDGSISTVRSMSFNEDGREILVPTVSPDGRILSDDEAIDLYHRTGQNLGMFDTPEDADAYAQTLHNQQEQMYAQPAAQPKGGRLPATDVDQAKAARDDYYSRGIYAGAYNPLGPIAKAIDAGASAAQRAPLFGWDDEAVASARSLAGNTDYTTAQAQEDAKKTAMRQQNPGASLAGDVGGALIMARGLPNITAGRALPVVGRAGGAAIEGGTYGAVVGAGEAAPGERKRGALMGAATGAVLGAGTSAVGDALASRVARKAASTTTQSADELKAASNALYNQAFQAGVSIHQQASDHMLQNMRLVAGNLNEKLRPSTSGIVDDLANDIGKPMTLERFHELRQEVDLAMKGANDADKMRLSRMRDVLNGFADNVQQASLNGPKSAVDTFRQADDLWRRRSKTQKIEDLFDLADVKSAKYSQSGMANAVRDKASQLYTRIVKGQEKGFSAEETALIRKLSKGELTPKVVNWLGKFAPRGIVSLGGGVGIGGTIGSMLGPAGTIAGAMLPGAIGFGAANVADRAAVRGLQALGTAASSGNAPVLGAISNRALPLIGPASGEASSQLARRR